MIACGNCKTEMTCSKTGRMMVWDGNHVYAGDEFECKGCGAKVCYAGGESFYEPKALEAYKDNCYNMTPTAEVIQ